MEKGKLSKRSMDILAKIQKLTDEKTNLYKNDGNDERIKEINQELNQLHTEIMTRKDAIYHEIARLKEERAKETDKVKKAEKSRRIDELYKILNEIKDKSASNKGEAEKGKTEKPEAEKPKTEKIPTESIEEATKKLENERQKLDEIKQSKKVRDARQKLNELQEKMKEVAAQIAEQEKVIQLVDEQKQKIERQKEVVAEVIRGKILEAEKELKATADQMKAAKEKLDYDGVLLERLQFNKIVEKISALKAELAEAELAESIDKDNEKVDLDQENTSPKSNETINPNQENTAPTHNEATSPDNSEKKTQDSRTIENTPMMSTVAEMPINKKEGRIRRFFKRIAGIFKNMKNKLFHRRLTKADLREEMFDDEYGDAGSDNINSILQTANHTKREETAEPSEEVFIDDSDIFGERIDVNRDAIDEEYNATVDKSTIDSEELEKEFTDDKEKAEAESVSKETVAKPSDFVEFKGYKFTDYVSKNQIKRILNGTAIGEPLLIDTDGNTLRCNVRTGEITVVEKANVEKASNPWAVLKSELGKDAPPKATASKGGRDDSERDEI